MLQITYQRGDDKYSNRAASMISCLHIIKAETVWTMDTRISQRTPSIKHAIRFQCLSFEQFKFLIQITTYTRTHIHNSQPEKWEVRTLSQNLRQFEREIWVFGMAMFCFNGVLGIDIFCWKKLRGQGSWTLPSTWWSYSYPRKQPQY